MLQSSKSNKKRFYRQTRDDEEDDDETATSSKKTLLLESEQLQKELEATLSKEDFNKVIELIETERELTLIEDSPF